jgi:hypothetical protein
MMFVATFRTELIKIKRSAALWVVILGAGFIPFVIMLSYVLQPRQNMKRLARYNPNPWIHHMENIWQSFSVFLLPLFIILICSLITQIEYKNNTWKQVYASPQSFGTIYFSKLGTVILMILLLFLLFNLFTIGAAIVANLFYPAYGFFDYSFSGVKLLQLNLLTIIATLGIIGIQYFLSMRFKNFIIPVGIGMACLIVTMMAMGWKHIFKIPYAFPFLTLKYAHLKNGGLQNHEWNAIGYFIVFTLIGWWDIVNRKERG